MLKDMNRLMQDSAFLSNDESRWLALNQLESFLNESRNSDLKRASASQEQKMTE